jgi:hypothetical protein
LKRSQELTKLLDGGISTAIVVVQFIPPSSNFVSSWLLFKGEGRRAKREALHFV